MNLNSLFIESIRTRSQLFNYQIVRWRRPKKPFWLGIAKSKMFVVPTARIVRTTEEEKVDKSLKMRYNSSYKALINFIQNDDPRLKDGLFEKSSGNEVQRSPGLEQKIEKSFKKNEIWNSESARLRCERTEIYKQKQIEKAVKQIDIHEERRIRKNEILESIVKKEKYLSQSFITPENLDEAIENCLNKVDCFDFAIDLDGNKFHGRESLPSRKILNEEQMVKEFFP